MTEIEAVICKLVDGSSCRLNEKIQSLWSGYGEIRRATIDGQSAIVKQIDISSVRENRRGWGSDFAHRRKVNSYRVEANFYQHFAARCDAECRVPKLLGSWLSDDDSIWLIVLEDLDACGFSLRKQELSDAELYACIRWLANFHATFIDAKPDRLWETGTYWHLATRPDEFQKMPSGPLKQAASAIDQKLNQAKFKTLVHGDAKVANFCFSSSAGSVAAVDFQYFGGGCGIKDVAYLISSCLDEREAAQRETEILTLYFRELEATLKRNDQAIAFNELEQEWRALYGVAWADFYRFLAGWSPGHWKLNQYAKKLTTAVIASLADE